MSNWISVIALISTFLYSILRYNIFGNVPFSDIPTYVLNKSIAFTVIILFVPMLISLKKKKLEEYYNYIKIVKIFILTHVLLSLSLLSQKYYPKLFFEEKITLFGNLAILFGVLSFVYLYNKLLKFRINLMYILISLHIFFIGFNNWFDYTKWNGYMPPITLICFLILLFTSMHYLINSKYLKGNLNSQENEIKNEKTKL